MNVRLIELTILMAAVMTACYTPMFLTASDLADMSEAKTTLIGTASTAAVAAVFGAYKLWRGEAKGIRDTATRIRDSVRGSK